MTKIEFLNLKDEIKNNSENYIPEVEESFLKECKENGLTVYIMELVQLPINRFKIEYDNENYFMVYCNIN